MREIFDQFRRPVEWERKALVFALGTLVLTVTGPFGTYEDLGFWERLVLWTTIMTGVGFFMHVAILIALTSKLLAPLPRVIRIVIGLIMAGLPGAAVVIFATQVFRLPVIQPSSLPMIWMQVTLIGLPLGLYEYALRPDTRHPPVPIRLLARLPPAIGSDIVSLSMQDHYVEVTTTQGKALILMRMSDAITELDGLRGQRIHRSHWVALAHVQAMRKNGYRRFVELKDGRKLPLSDTYAETLKS